MANDTLIDIVDIFAAVAASRGYKYLYGRRTALNLLDMTPLWTGDKDALYFLHEFRKGSPQMNAYKTATTGTRYTGTFYLASHSDRARAFYSEESETETTFQGNYQIHIRPLVEELHAFFKEFACTTLDVETFTFDDVSDLLDANVTGLMINYTVFVPNGYRVSI